MPRISPAVLIVSSILMCFPPGAAQTETFRDWRADCFPEGGCEASTGENVQLIIERTSDDSAGWFMAIEFRQEQPRTDRAMTLKVDDGGETVLGDGDYRAFRRPERFYVTKTSRLNALLPAVLSGNEIEISYFDVTNELKKSTLSLSGVTASLLWIEDQMKLVGEPRLAAAPEGLAEAKPSRDDNIRDAGIPEVVQFHHERTSSCEIYDDRKRTDLGVFIEPLGASTILYALPCTHHAYNVTYRLYARDTGELGGVRTLHFASFSDETNWTGTDLLFNIDIDGRQLTAFYKGRGLGDCGTAGSWTWQDFDYRLDRYAAQSDCNGVPADQWPVIFPAAR